MARGPVGAKAKLMRLESEYEALVSLRQGLGITDPSDLRALPDTIRRRLGIDGDTGRDFEHGLSELGKAASDTRFSPQNRELLSLAFNFEGSERDWLGRTFDYALTRGPWRSERTVRQHVDEAILALADYLVPHEERSPLMPAGPGLLTDGSERSRGPEHSTFATGLFPAHSAGDFYVVLPRFSLSQEIRSRITDIDRRHWYTNESIQDLHSVDAPELIAKDDSYAGTTLAALISELSGGTLTPLPMDDGARDVDYDKPAAVVGLYSNRWVNEYWHSTSREALFLPLGDQDGVRVRSESGDSDDAPFYREVRPLGKDRQPIPNFWAAPEAVHWDYGVVARVLGHPYQPLGWWLICAGIGATGTAGAAWYLSASADSGSTQGRLKNLDWLVRSFAEDEQWVVLIEVERRHPHCVRLVHAFPEGKVTVETPNINEAE